MDVAAPGRAMTDGDEDRGQAVSEGELSRTTFAARVRELVATVPVLAAAIEPLLTAHATLRESFAELHRQLLGVTRIDPCADGS